MTLRDIFGIRYDLILIPKMTIFNFQNSASPRGSNLRDFMTYLGHVSMNISKSTALMCFLKIYISFFKSLTNLTYYAKYI